MPQSRGHAGQLEAGAGAAVLRRLHDDARDGRRLPCEQPDLAGVARALIEEYGHRSGGGQLLEFRGTSRDGFLDELDAKAFDRLMPREDPAVVRVDVHLRSEELSSACRVVLLFNSKLAGLLAEALGN